MRSERARIITKCMADRYASPHERIVEFTFPGGPGGLLTFMTNDAGEHIVIVNADADIVVVSRRQKVLVSR